MQPTPASARFLGGQVIEVLPNGMLVIEAAREVEFSQQKQTIILRGIVRPEDISQQNRILSTAISSLELEVRGKGIVTDYTHRPNALVRLLQTHTDLLGERMIMRRRQNQLPSALIAVSDQFSDHRIRSRGQSPHGNRSTGARQGHRND